MHADLACVGGSEHSRRAGGRRDLEVDGALTGARLQRYGQALRLALPGATAPAARSPDATVSLCAPGTRPG